MEVMVRIQMNNIIQINRSNNKFMVMMLLLSRRILENRFWKLGIMRKNLPNLWTTRNQGKVLMSIFTQWMNYMHMLTNSNK